MFAWSYETFLSYCRTFASFTSSSANKSIGDELLDHALNHIPKEFPKTELESSVTYLKDIQVRAKFNELLQSIKAVGEVQMGWKRSLGIVFLAAKATGDDDRTWLLEFWPCRDCACISCLPCEKDH